MNMWEGSGAWSGWRMTTDHPASDGSPVLVSPTGQAYTPSDIEKPPRTLLRAIEVAAYLGITRQAVSQLEQRASKATYRGKFPRPAERGLWDAADIERYKLEKECERGL